MNDEIMQPFYEYLEKRREVLLTELDMLERLMGISPRNAEIRRQYKQMVVSEADTLVGVVKYEWFYDILNKTE